MKRHATYDKVDELSDYRAARLRTETYFGSREPVTELIAGFDGAFTLSEVTFVPALNTYWREILDNARDEVRGHGHGTTISLSFDPATLTFTVEDDGRGIPSDLVEKLLARARAGRNFRERGEVAGTNGVGASVTNFTSEFFEVDSRHDGVRHVQKFEELPDGDDLWHGQASVTKCSRADHGLKVRFRPSRHVYPHMLIPESFVKARMYEVAAANPGLKVLYNGQRLLPGKRPADDLFSVLKHTRVDVDTEVEITQSGARILGMSGSRVVKKPFKTSFYLCRGFHDGKADAGHSVVNGICAYNGGTVMAGFRTVVVKGVAAALEKEAKRRKLTIEKQDVLGGLLVVAFTDMSEPNFDSQNKSRLINPEADRAVSRCLDEAYWRKFLKANPDWAEDVLARAEARSRTEDGRSAEKLLKKAARAKVAKLIDAVGSDRSKCVLFVAEGDSAIKGITQVRDPRVHGGLPLRGKVMNVNGESASKIAKSEQLVNVMNALGLRIGERAVPRSRLRYGAVYITTDEDEDGRNIMCLIVNFLYTFWPELFDPALPPYVYKFDTPYIIVERRGERRYFFGRNYHEFRPEDFKGWGEPVRAKGVGRLEPRYWQDMLASPSLTPFVDDGGLKAALDLVFNPARADDRKRWLEEDPA